MMRRSIFKNAVSQIGGRLFLSFSRLAIAAIIVRYAGADRFGEYMLILSFLLIAEWLTDFGQTEITVRDISQDVSQENRWMIALVLLKLVQGMVVYLLLIAALYMMGYPGTIVRAGIIGGIGVCAYSFALIYRTSFRVHMTMGKDVLAEVIGVSVMVPLIWYASIKQLSVEFLVVCYVVSRVVFMLAAIIFGRARTPIKIIRFSVNDLHILLKQSLPLGVLGLMVCLYDNLAILVLSKYSDMQSVAYFSSAMRFVFPAVIVIQAISTTVYPVLSKHWCSSKPEFQALQQNALDASFMIAVGIFCVLNAASGFLMGLLGSEMYAAAYVLQILSFALLAKSIITVMAPILIISEQQNKAMWLTSVSLIFKLLVLLYMVPKYGVLGAAIAYLLTEFVIGMLPVVWLAQRLTGVYMQWHVVTKTVFCALFALGVSHVALTSGSIWSGLFVLLVYIILLVISGALSIEKMKLITMLVKGRLSPVQGG